MRKWLAMDIGGTKVAVAIVTEDGQVTGQMKISTQGGSNAQLSHQLQQLLLQVCANTGVSPHELAGVGVDVPGLVERETGIALGAVNLGFQRLPIATVLGEVTSAPVAVENDTNAGALGEKWFGAGRNVEDFAYVAVGTGVGGGLVLGGHLYMGFHGGAGEIGHCIVDPAGLLCRCGQVGCLEAMVSGVGMPRLAAKLLGEEAARRIGDGELPSPHQLYAAVENGHMGAREVTQAVGRYLAVAVVNLFRSLDVEKVIIAGGVAAAGAMFIQAVYAGLRSVGSHIPTSAVELSPLGDRGTLLGAAAVARERVGV